MQMKWTCKKGQKGKDNGAKSGKLEQNRTKAVGYWAGFYATLRIVLLASSQPLCYSLRLPPPPPLLGLSVLLPVESDDLYLLQSCSSDPIGAVEEPPFLPNYVRLPATKCGRF